VSVIFAGDMKGLVFVLAFSLYSCSVLAQSPSASPQLILKADIRSLVISGLTEKLIEYYIFPEVATRMVEDLRAREKRGEYDAISEPSQFSQLLTKDLRAISRDKHLRIFYSKEPLSDRVVFPPPAFFEDQRAEYARRNNGFEKVERLAGNIGYLDLRLFAPPEFGAETTAAAMNFLANCDALIIDLRKNGGGKPAMVAFIASYLFGPTPVHLNDLYIRRGNITQEFWTLPFVPGRRLENKPVYVLTSNFTFSGAEEFAYNLKNLKRGLIVGEITGGGAHPVSNQPVHKHFGISVPYARAVSPITKTNWEGTGVEPDVKVPAQEALHWAHLDAVQKLLAQAKDPDQRELLEDALKSLQK
jgi:hypothetical protein